MTSPPQHAREAQQPRPVHSPSPSGFPAESVSCARLISFLPTLELPPSSANRALYRCNRDRNSFCTGSSSGCERGETEGSTTAREKTVSESSVPLVSCPRTAQHSQRPHCCLQVIPVRN